MLEWRLRPLDAAGMSVYLEFLQAQSSVTYSLRPHLGDFEKLAYRRKRHVSLSAVASTLKAKHFWLVLAPGGGLLYRRDATADANVRGLESHSKGRSAVAEGKWSSPKRFRVLTTLDSFADTSLLCVSSIQVSAPTSSLTPAILACRLENGDQRTTSRRLL